MDDDQSPSPDSVARITGDEPDPTEIAAVQQALAGLDFLRSGGPEPTEPMPDWAWDRLSIALAAQSAPASSSSRWIRWGGGLVAASVAVLAIGVAVTAFSGGNDPALVAEGATDATAAKLSAEAPAPAAEALVSPRMLSFAGMVPPTLRLVDSKTDYTSPTLTTQVSTVLHDMGMEPVQAEQAMSEPPAEVAVPDTDERSILGSSRMLRDCITKLTEVANSTALLIDWATFEGRDAGVVVAPEYLTPTAPDLTELDIWVIDPNCDVQVTLHMAMP